MKGRLVALLLFAELTACVPAAPVTSPTRPTTSTADEVRSLVTLINHHRRNIGCPTLAWNSVVARVAQTHSDDMIRRNYFAHNTLEGETPGHRLEAAGIRWAREAENIAAGQRTAQEVYDSWMRSSGHRANIENCALREHGIGFTRGRRTVPYGAITSAWTHDFVTLR